MEANNHIWSFSTIGGVRRVNLESGADLKHLSGLDPKLWTALSCPVTGLEIDQKTLELIDSDKDGQIRVPEVIAAVNWITAVLKNPGDLLKQEALFPLSALNDESEAGRTLLASARIILKTLGKEDATTISVEETSDTEKIFSASRFNGDGVVTEVTAADPGLAQLLTEIAQCVGSVPDRSGKPGIDAVLLQTFMDQCTAFVSWYEKCETDAKTILPLGEQTEAAYQNYTALKSKADDFFIRCRLAAFDSQSTAMLNLQISRVESITAKDLSVCMDEIATYPLAKVEAGSNLPLSVGINPAWEKIVTSFRSLTASHLFGGRESLSEAEWNKAGMLFAPYAQWIAEKAGTLVSGLGITRIREILSGNGQESILGLIQQDLAVQNEANGIILVDKLVRYHRDLFTLLKNFVTFFDFYSSGSKGIFQAGTLYIDQRSCDLCIRVSDMTKHASMVSFSGMFLIYCDCVSRSTNQTMKIVAALTNGDIDNLVVGRNALFYDRKGKDWDATVIKIVDNPISIRQAFFSPYRKVSRFIEAQVNKVATAEDDKIHKDVTGHIEKIPLKTDETQAKKAPAPPFDVGKFVGIFAAIGLALGAIGSALASLVAGFMGLVWWKMPFAIVGLLLLISGPSMIIAYLKLRKRNLAPILDANGWAINARVNLNIPFGNSLTLLAELPKGAKINLNDPFTKKKKPLLPVVFGLSVLAGIILYALWKYGVIHIHF
ncbi:MAG TPA: hypothetical protein VNZ86_17330 [Bacteroidia bacterium]|jgi:hypothetical protein|nr:hypothetical protein [Bacteroidia bacterium]